MPKFSFRSKPHPTSLLRDLQLPRGESNRTSLSSTPASICILFVPDLCVKEPEALLKSSWAQLAHSFPPDTTCHVLQALGFEYCLEISDAKSVWTAIIKEAKELVERLIKKVESHLLPGSSLIFVCHGLGGILAKEALADIYGKDQSDSRKTIRDLHRGTVLLGTPHLTTDRNDKWAALIPILRHTLRLPKPQYCQAELERRVVAKISENFQERVGGVLVISVCETRPTTVQTSWKLLPSTKDELLLVEKTIATTGVLDETVVELDTDHSGLLVWPDNSEMLEAIKTLFKKALKWTSAGALSRSSLPSSSNDGTNESVNDIISEDSWERADQPNEIYQQYSDSDDYINLVNRSRAEVAALSELASDHKSLTVPYFMLKPSERNPQFSGRRDMLAIMEDALLPNKTKLATNQPSDREFAIFGLGGVGKTELAREFAFSRQDRYDAVFWIEAAQTTQISEGFAAIAAKLGYTAGSDQDRVVSRNIARDWLSNPIKRLNPKRHQDWVTGGDTDLTGEAAEEATWLLIFNNADDLSLLEEYWPTAHKGSIVLTSRDPLARSGRKGAELEPLGQEDAAKLLRELACADSPADVKASLGIAKRLGGLPLAITQIAAFIDRYEMTLPEFLVYFDEQTSIEKLAKARPLHLHSRDHYKHSLFTVWTLEMLPQHGLALLEALSFLNPDSIKESLVNTFPANGYPQPLLPEGFPTTNEEYLTARLDLTKVSLIKRNKPEARLTLHRLVQDVVKSQMSSHRAAQMLEMTALLTLNAWPTKFLQFDHNTATWEASEELLPHILRLQSAFEKSATIVSAQMRQNLSRLLLFAGWYLLERSDFDAAKPLLLHVLRLSDHEVKLDNESPVMDEIRADALFSLSALSAQINENIDKNLQYARDHFDLRVTLRDGTAFGELRMAMAHGELAHIQMLAGQYEDAIHHAQVAIDMTEVSEDFKNGSDFPTFSSTHQAFALGAIGEYDKAMERLHLALRYWTSRSSAGHSFQLGIIQRCIGFVKRQQGLAEDSFHAYLEAMKHFTDTVGDNSHYVAQMCSNLGAYHTSNGEYETAQMHLENAARIYRIHGCYQAQLALALFRTGTLRAAMGDHEGAETLFAEAKRLYLEVSRNSGEADFELTVERMMAMVPLPSR